MNFDNMAEGFKARLCIFAVAFACILHDTSSVLLAFIIGCVTVYLLPRAFKLALEFADSGKKND